MRTATTTSGCSGPGASPHGDAGPGASPTPRRWAVLGVLAAALLLVAIDATVLNLAVTELAEDLVPSAVGLLWIVNAYALVLAGLLVSAGTLGDRWGRKRLLLVGLAAFGAGSLLAAYAPSTGLLIAARAVLGLGGAMIMPATLSVLRAVFTDPGERMLAVGVWSAVASAGAAVGPIVGGVLLEHFWWGSVFLINVPVLVVLVGLTAWLVPESRDPAPGRWDAASALLSIAGTGALVYGIKQAGAHGPGALGAVLPVLAGAVLLTVFVRRQLRLPEPLLDVALFRDRRFGVAVLGNLLTMFALSGTLFFAGQHLQIVLGYGPLEAGLALLPMTVASAACALLVRRLVHRYGHRLPLSVGAALMAAGLAALAVAGLVGGYTPVVLALVGVGAGAGLAMTSSSDAVVSSAPPARAGGAAAIGETGYELGAVTGIAVLGSAMAGAYTHSAALQAVPGVPAAALEAARESLPAAAHTAAVLGPPAGPALLDAAREAFGTGLLATLPGPAALLLVVAVGAWRLLPGTPRRVPAEPQPAEPR